MHVMQVVDYPSNNHNEREGAAVDTLVLHYTGMPTAKEALEKLADGAAEHRVSAHYLVDEDGGVYRLVPESARAWHAGKSFWRGQDDINSRSIGIEIVNPGHGPDYRPFPPAQMAAVAALAKDIMTRHAIPSWNVVAHSDIAPGRKQDPGELFDWRWLAAQGIGIWPQAKAQKTQGFFENPIRWAMQLLGLAQEPALEAGAEGPAVLAMQNGLSAFGYGVPRNGQFDEQTRAVVLAFQRHFRPARVDGRWDEECAVCLNDLLACVPAATLQTPDGRMTASQR